MARNLVQCDRCKTTMEPGNAVIIKEASRTTMFKAADLPSTEIDLCPECGKEAAQLLGAVVKFPDDDLDDESDDETP